jgi:hypothetical protein
MQPIGHEAEGIGGNVSVELAAFVFSTYPRTSLKMEAAGFWATCVSVHTVHLYTYTQCVVTKKTELFISTAVRT